MKNTRCNGMTFTSAQAKARIAKILRACGNGLTRQKIEMILGLTRRTTLSYLVHLQATGQIYVCGWTREAIGYFYPVPVYKTGQGIDAPKPPPLDETAKQKRAWAKLKADPIRYAKHKAKKSGKPVQSPNSPFNWRGQPSLITKSAEWMQSQRSSLATMSAGTGIRPQFTINEASC